MSTQQKARAVKPAISKRFSEQEVKDTITKYYGNKALVVASLDCSPQQLEVWLRKGDRKQFLAEAREKVLDKCEEKLLSLLESDNEKVALDTAKFILQHLGRARGYNGDSPAIQLQVQKSGEDIKVAIQGIFGM